MKRYLRRYLKAGLAGLWLIGSIAWAADSPRVTVDSQSIGANKADIHFNSVINGDNHMDIVITQGGQQGCPAGQNWDIGRGGCTAAVALRSVSTSRACSCTCPQSGSCTSSQSGSYTVFGWRLPTNGRELISYNGATSWGACTVVSNSCSDDGGSGNGTPPPSGTVYIVEAFICNSSHPQYNSGPLGDSEKSQIIATYRAFNFGSRCPEQGGYVYWQNQWQNWALEYQRDNPGVSLSRALAKTWTFPTEDSMRRAAAENGEGKDSYMAVLNNLCSQYGTQKFGVPVNATYIKFSGSSCVVN